MKLTCFYKSFVTAIFHLLITQSLLTDGNHGRLDYECCLQRPQVHMGRDDNESTRKRAYGNLMHTASHEVQLGDI